jgi:hypothetical protein
VRTTDSVSHGAPSSAYVRALSSRCSRIVVVVSLAGISTEKRPSGAVVPRAITSSEKSPCDSTASQAKPPRPVGGPA